MNDNDDIVHDDGSIDLDNLNELQYRIRHVMLVTGETILGKVAIVISADSAFVRIVDPIRFMYESDTEGNVAIVFERLTLFSTEHAINVPADKVIGSYGVVQPLADYYQHYVEHCKEIVDVQNIAAIQNALDGFTERSTNSTEQILERQKQSIQAVQNIAKVTSNTTPVVEAPKPSAEVIPIKKHAKFVDMSANTSANTTPHE